MQDEMITSDENFYKQSKSQPQGVIHKFPNLWQNEHILIIIVTGSKEL